MEQDNKRIIPINIEEEMKSSYIDYSMSVIVSRALPDVRDGLKPVHRRVLYGMSELGLTAGAAYKKSARIVGECFVAGTRVLTDQGLLPIEQVQRGDRVYTQHGISPVTELYEMPERALVRVTLESGLSVTVTPDQPLKVLDENLTYTWKAARDLSEADHVVMRATYPDDLPYVSLPDWQGRPVRLTEDLAYLVGLFLSDGWVARDHGRFGFYSTERDVVERVQRTLCSHFGYEARIEDVSYEYQPEHGPPRVRTAWQARIHSQALNAYLAETLDIPAGTNAATKRIPPCFWQSPRPVLAALLSGLFDGDGSIHRHRSQVHYGTISPALADDVQLLLLHLGVLATRFVSERSGRYVAGRSVACSAPFHAIEASGVYARRVAELLQLSHPEKQARLDRIRKAPLKVTKYDRVPYAAGPVFEELSAHHAGGGWYRDGDGNAFRQGLRYPGGSKIRHAAGLRDGYLGRTQLNDWGIRDKLERIGSDLAPFVTGLLDHDVHFIRVRSVEAAPAEKTYDLQVAGPHEFVANGIVSHNCLGKYHPHGDSAVYDTMVRMAQDFSMRYPLVDGQGNFGSVDGDSAAAMRYTEARMTRIAEEMLRDINKETVDFTENFDGSLEEPSVMPAALPNLLLNGSDGIAVGMATKIPPHNLGEVVDGIVAYIDDREIDLKQLMQYIPAPDFPTGGIIYGTGGVKSAYYTGRGRVVIRAKMHEEEIRPGRMALVVTEIPYQVNKSSLIEKIAHLVRDKRIEGISELRDESDREGMRIVIELRKDAVPLVTQNQLYKYTQCQQTFGVNMVALVGGRPRTISLKEAIQHFVEHRHEVVVRRTRYDLRKAQERAHILEGLTVALDHLDAVITIIRQSEDTDDARRNLMAGVFPERLTVPQLDRLGLPTHGQSMFTLSEAQADAILALRLSRLTGLERQKIEDEYREVLKEIERLQAILASEALRMQIIKDELLELKGKYADPRRTEIDYTGGGDIIIEDLIEDEQVVVTITHQGLIKRTPVAEYRAQGRGGVGMRGSGMRDEDYIEHLFGSSNHDYLLFFTDHGRCYWLRVYEIPEGTRTSKGRSIRNLIQIAPEDRVRAVLAIRKEQFEDSDFLNSHYVMMATRKGLVKKTPLEAFSRPRIDGIIAISILDGDELLEAHLTDGNAHVIIAASSGLAIRFPEDDARPMGRNTQGVRGIALGSGEYVVGMVVITDDEHDILAISANGYGKRTALDDYRVQGRGGKGIITMRTTPKTGPLVAIRSVLSSDDLMISTQNGIMIRMNVAGISTLGRNTQGVRLISLRESDAIADVTRLVIEDEEAPINGHADGAAVDGEAAAPEAAVETA